MSIIVERTHIKVTNYDIGDCVKLERQFSVFDQLYHTFFPKGIWYDEEYRTLYLPRGIDIDWLERVLYDTATYSEEFDPADTVDPILIKYLPRDDVQKQALEFMLGTGDYFYTKNRTQLSVNLNTGVGKTYVSIAMASYLQTRTIVITSSINWINQWKERIIEYTDTKKEDIYIISGAATITRLLNGTHDINHIKFLLLSHATINAYAKKHGWNAVSELFKFFKVGLKIYDESHLYFDNTLMVDFYSNTKKTVYLTATPARSDKDENRVYQLAFKNVPKIDLFNEETDPHTKYIAIHYNSRPNPQQISSCRNAYGFDILKYIDYVSWKSNFYELIYVLLDMVLPLDGKILIYIGKNDVINIIYNWMTYNFPQLAGNIGIYNSTIPKTDKPAMLEKKVILSTTKSCGAAMDIKDLKCTIVLAEPFGSLVTTRQTLGRTRDRDTYYIDIIDNGFDTLVRYFNKKKSTFNKYAEECKNIYLSDRELHEKCNNIKWKMNNAYNDYLKSLNQEQGKKVIFRRK